MKEKPEKIVKDMKEIFDDSMKKIKKILNEHTNKITTIQERLDKYKENEKRNKNDSN